MASQTHTHEHTAHTGATRATGGLHLGSLVLAGVTLDLLIVTPLIWALARADATNLWPLTQPASLLFLLLPAILVAGVWGAHAFALRNTNSFLVHLARTLAGALIASLFATAMFLAFNGDLTSDRTFIVACGVTLICALHANYFGAIRALIRAGIVARPEDTERA